MSERAVSRREVLKGSVALAISAGSMRIIGADFEHVPLACASLGTDARDTAADLLDTWIVVHQDGAVTVYFGKTDLAQGVDTAIAQVVAEELDVSVDAVSVVMGDTALTPNQGGLSASTACSAAAKPLRNAAAEARRLLIEAAAAHFGIASEGLSALDGVVFVTESKDRRVSYGQLIGGKGFAAKLEWNRREGNFLDVVGRAKPKDPASYRVVGQPVPRKDLPGKIFASTEFCHHVSIPGMLHGRMVRPPVANAIPQSVDEGSLDKGRSEQVVRVGNLLGVVAPTEWGAIKAAQRLRVTWSKTEAPFPSMSELHEHIRQAAPVTGNAANAFFGKTVPYDPLPTERIIEDSARVLNAEYELPFQSHARMAPSVAVADVSAECALIYSDTQKPHAMRAGLAKLLGLPVQQVRVVWRPGAGSYGRSDADEAAFEAALLSRAVGRPIRVQWMRHEGHAWDPKAPAAVVRVKAGLDQAGHVTAFLFHAKGFSGWDVAQSAANPGDTLAGMLLGMQKTGGQNFAVPEQSYDFPNAVRYWETIAPLQAVASPLRTSHMRGPQEPQVQFAQESFIDEMAVAIGEDPVAFRRRHLKDDRELAVLNALAAASRWSESPRPGSGGKGETLFGRGIAAGPMFGTYVAVACEVEVDRNTGRIWPRTVIVAHDCGLVINPLGLKGTIEGNVIQGLSRALCEEVKFDPWMVRSRDWQSYPILNIRDAPEAVEIVRIERAFQPSSGAGEATLVFVAPALANAVFDATGVRFRRLPLTPERIKSELSLKA